MVRPRAKGSRLGSFGVGLTPPSPPIPRAAKKMRRKGQRSQPSQGGATIVPQRRARRQPRFLLEPHEKKIYIFFFALPRGVALWM